MSNVRFLGLGCAVLGLYMMYLHSFPQLVTYGTLGIGILFYAVIGYQETYQRKEIHIGEY